jgi:hypothetical protein
VRPCRQTAHSRTQAGHPAMGSQAPLRAPARREVALGVCVTGGF